MPNHITNWVEITGSSAAIAKLKKATIQHIKKDKSVAFDFNGMIPMPKELKETQSPTEVVDTQAQADIINANRAPSLISQDTHIKAISKAEGTRRKQKYGAVNWHDFACNKWGTKWGAYAVSIIKEDNKKLVLKFNTAWSPPEPIFDWLSEPNKFTKEGFTVNCYWEDEDPDNNGEYNDGSVFDVCHTTEVEYTG